MPRMTRLSRLHWATGRRRWRVRLLAILGTAAVLAAAPAAAYARSTSPPAARLSARGGAAASSSQPKLKEDLSERLPNLSYLQTTGNFLGEDHYQVARVEDGQLKIFEANKFGGDLKKSVPTDLKVTPEAGFDHWIDYKPWQTYQYGAVGSLYHLTAVKIASNSKFIFMAGATWNGDGQTAIDSYRLRLYVLPHDGSCASASCAYDNQQLPTIYTYKTPIGPDEHYTVVPTSLAVGEVGGQTLVAVGLSELGIRIYRLNDSHLDYVTDIRDMGWERCILGCYPVQTPVTALGFGPPTGPGQDGVLAAGVEALDAPGASALFSYRLNPDGTMKSMTKAGGWNDLELAATVVRINGELYTVFGRTDGTVFVMNIDSGKELTHYADHLRRPGQDVSGLMALTPWDGSPGNQDLVLARLDGTNDQVLRYVNGDLKPVKINSSGADGGDSGVSSNQLEQWYPGYGLGLLAVSNNIAGPVSVSMASREDPKYGCWLNASLTENGIQVPAFPDEPARVAAGQTSPFYLIAALTGGVDGECASAQGVGERSAYVVITPHGEPADEHIVKLRVDESRTVEIADQTGGDLTATVKRAGGPGGLWGPWVLTITGPAAPTAAAAPTLAGFRLTSAPLSGWRPPKEPVADDPRRPVYRFDVTGATWTVPGATPTVPGADGRLMAQIPAMTAQGYDKQNGWHDLGKLMPVTTPAWAGDTVTLGQASFFWQNAPGTLTKPDTEVTEVRVVSGIRVSNEVPLAGLKPPPLDATYPARVNGITATPADGVSAHPLADGIDQAPLDIAFTTDTPHGVIPTDDPRYNLIYYRDAANSSLITGLYAPGSYTDYLAVAPWRGAYPNDGAPAAEPAGPRAGAPAKVHSYLVTTSTASQRVYAVMNDTGTDGGDGGDGLPHSPEIGVNGRSASLDVTGTAANGVRVTGCGGANLTCPLTGPVPQTLPLLYQAGGASTGPVIGLQFRIEAVTAAASLPLEVGTENAHHAVAAPLVVNGNSAALRKGSAFWPSGKVDTALVSSGTLVRALSIPVGG